MNGRQEIHVKTIDELPYVQFPVVAWYFVLTNQWPSSNSDGSLNNALGVLIMGGILFIFCNHSGELLVCSVVHLEPWKLYYHHILSLGTSPQTPTARFARLSK